MSASKKFRGLLEPYSKLNWTIVKLPFDVAKAWKTRNRLHVKGTINGFAFRTSLFGSAQDGHFLLVNRQMQKGAGAVVGGMAEVVIEADLEERRSSVPPELARLLKQYSALKKWYEQLSVSARDDIARNIGGPKSDEARLRRAEQMVERMMLAMEGERELPPILQMQFTRYPQARAGWQAMTPVQRRGHLLGIFYYQSPESREKRARKAIDEALKIARTKGREA
ncbi:MAG TPA: YdeI/OmpD-associated family protein [Edaphobacter sp.]|uniref:YdeI/OmpD-associated family protein n=1 Tax=Edaphobacter sp. TaxID=1934404 RepID=UPI002C6185A3|nr:YdeI/OmpD-associated family protein [Edaphobacter sp.]HUZ97692.1 YdeI/OmpD-associated family protein [Edaphobacter sp.]